MPLHRREGGIGMAPLLTVSKLQVYFPIRSGILMRTVGHVHAVEDVSFTIDRGEVFSLVGESGCGKSTTGNAILRLIQPTGGNVVFDGVDLGSLSNEEMRLKRNDMQMIFQNPYSSLDPRMTVNQLLEEPLRVYGRLSATQRAELVAAMLDRVVLAREYGERYPHQFSGGQKQRVGIARALICSPRFVVADEPVSALDVSIQAQILNLLIDLQKEMSLSMLFISHNLHVVRHISNRLGVMYLGSIMELGTTEEVFTNSVHPYTKALMAAVPTLDPEKRQAREILEGDVPNPSDPPKGCPFYPRCRYSQDRCREEKPLLRSIGNDHWVACHYCGV